VPRTDAVIAGAVQSALEMGNGFSRATVSRRTLMSLVALMFAPGVTLFLTLYVGSRRWKGTRGLLDAAYLMHYTIR
jgi:hypothetical protein